MRIVAHFVGRKGSQTNIGEPPTPSRALQLFPAVRHLGTSPSPALWTQQEWYQWYPCSLSHHGHCQSPEVHSCVLSCSNCNVRYASPQLTHIIIECTSMDQCTSCRDLEKQDLCPVTSGLFWNFIQMSAGTFLSKLRIRDDD